MRRELIIVSENQLFSRGHIVFVDDGNNPVLQECIDRTFGMVRPPAGVKIVRGQQYLRRQNIKFFKLFLIDTHQIGLPHSGNRLTVRQYRFVYFQFGVARRHSTGRDENHFIAFMKLRQKLRQPGNPLPCQPILFTEDVRPHFDDNPLHTSSLSLFSCCTTSLSAKRSASILMPEMEEIGATKKGFSLFVSPEKSNACTNTGKRSSN